MIHFFDSSNNLRRSERLDSARFICRFLVLRIWRWPAGGSSGERATRVRFGILKEPKRIHTVNSTTDNWICLKSNHILICESFRCSPSAILSPDRQFFVAWKAQRYLNFPDKISVPSCRPFRTPVASIAGDYLRFVLRRLIEKDKKPIKLIEVRWRYKADDLNERRE